MSRFRLSTAIAVALRLVHMFMHIIHSFLSTQLQHCGNHFVNGLIGRVTAIDSILTAVQRLQLYAYNI
jgi:hypothetical protein